MISIIIPTLNEEKIIEKTLKCLRGYTGDCEIIVSDGRSTDKTIEIAKKYADRVVVYEGTARQNIAMGKNLGASVATGDYFLFLDADLYIPNIDAFFEKILSSFNSDPKLVGEGVYMKVFKEMATLGDKLVFWGFNRMLYFNNNILHTGGCYGEFQMVRASVFKKLGGYNEKLVAAEDFEFFNRLSKVGKTRMEPSLVVFHTSRRAHKVGWPKLLATWFVNWISMIFLRKSYTSEWKEVR